jgi:SAM-dependent methyltransferase
MTQPAAVRARRRLLRAANRILGPTAVRHHLLSLRFRGRRTAYQPKKAFERYHDAALEAGDFTDEGTIKKGHDPLRTRYHYNAVENAILEHFVVDGGARPSSVLDIGSGAGHWIEFYHRLLGAGRVVGAEISAPLAAALSERYTDDPAISVLELDVGSQTFSLDERFDVVNAIGVMFHVVEDEAWRRAVRNLGGLLAPGGVLIVGDQFGRRTKDVGFKRAEDGGILVNKRIRSLRAWKACAADAGLDVLALHRTRKSRRIDTPENNILVLGRGSD